MMLKIRYIQETCSEEINTGKAKVEFIGKTIFVTGDLEFIGGISCKLLKELTSDTIISLVNEYNYYYSKLKYVALSLLKPRQGTLFGYWNENTYNTTKCTYHSCIFL